MRVCIIFNPTAGGEKAQRFRRHLDGLRSECSLRPTLAAGHGRALAADAVREEYDTIVAAGGDGTVNEVLNGLGDAPDGFARARLGIIPLGTVNVFAKEIGLPADVARAWAVIRRGHERRLDLPCAEFGPPARRERRYFIQMAGAGLDSRAIALVDWEWKKRVGPLAYVAAGLRAWRGPPVRVTADSGPHAATGELVLIGNGRFYGGRFVLFPVASLQDGLLEVRVFRQVDWMSLVRAGLGLLIRRSFRVPGERSFQAESLTLTASADLPFELDGDNVGSLPATLSIRRGVLRVVGPAPGTA